MIVAEARIDHAAACIDHHLLIERGAERLRDAALDLAAALHRIGDAAGIGRLYALQNLDLAGALVHRDAEALHVEGDRARRARRAAACGEHVALVACELRELRKANAL